MISGLDFSPSDTHHLIRQTIQQFAQQFILPIANEMDHHDTFPQQLWPKLGEIGLLGMTVDESYGGTNMGYLAHVIAMEEISRASGALGLSYGAHSNLCINQIHQFGTEEQKQKYLPPLIEGRFIGALAMSEVGAGSDVMQMSCKAQDKGNHYLLNGTKMWITNGSMADVIVTYAKTQTAQGDDTITPFIIETTIPGFKTAQKLNKLGMRGSPTCELVFSNCLVPKENILGGRPHQGKQVLLQGLDYERLILAGGPVGLMQACLDHVLPYVRERKQFTKPIGEFQLMKAKLADMYTALNASRAYLYGLASHCDQAGKLTSKDAASVLLFVAEHATQVALEAIQCLGGNGYINDFPVGRFLRDAKLYEIGAGTAEIRRIIVGRALLRETQ